jgi:hypothetical protein
LKTCEGLPLGQEAKKLQDSHQPDATINVFMRQPQPTSTTLTPTTTPNSNNASNADDSDNDQQKPKGN